MVTTAESRVPRRCRHRYRQAHPRQRLRDHHEPGVHAVQGAGHQAAVLALLRRRHDERYGPAWRGRSSPQRRGPRLPTNTTMNSAAAFRQRGQRDERLPAMHETRHTIGARCALAFWRVRPRSDVLLPVRQHRHACLARHHWRQPRSRSMASIVVFPGRRHRQLVGSVRCSSRAAACTARVTRLVTASPQGIHYFEPLNTDTGYWSTWSAILALSDADFGTGLNNGGMTTNVGYDRYGRASVRHAGDVQPDAGPRLLRDGQPDVDGREGRHRHGRRRHHAHHRQQNSFAKGDSNYIGTEFNLGMGWKFAPNASLDMIGAWLNAGSALDTAEACRLRRSSAANPPIARCERRLRVHRRACGCPSSSSYSSLR